MQIQVNTDFGIVAAIATIRWARLPETDGV